MFLVRMRLLYISATKNHLTHTIFTYRKLTIFWRPIRAGRPTSSKDDREKRSLLRASQNPEFTIKFYVETSLFPH